MTRALTVLLVSFLTLLAESSPDGAGAQEGGPSIASLVDAHRERLSGIALKISGPRC